MAAARSIPKLKKVAAADKIGNPYLVKVMMPICFIDKPGFHRMLGKFDSKCALTTHKYFSKEATPSLYLCTR